MSTKHPLTDEQIDALVDEIQERLGDSTARKYGRRGVLAALGLATLGTGSASAQASGSVGTQSNPVDVFGYDLDVANALQSDLDAGGNALTNVRSVSTESASTDALVGTLIVGQGQYDTIQSAIDAMPSGSSGTMTDYSEGEVWVPFKDGAGWEESVSFSGHKHLTLKSLGQNSARIAGSGDHAVKMNESDAELNGFRVDQTDGTGDYDAVLVEEREARIKDIGIDYAPRYGINVDEQQVHITDVEISGGDRAALGIGGGGGSQSNECVAHGVTIKDCPALGIEEVAGTFGWQLDAIITNPGTDGALLGSNNNLNLKIRDADTGLQIFDGSNNVGQVATRNCTTALEINGNSGENAIFGHFDGNVILGPNTQDNTVAGVCSGTLTDDGTNNDTSNLTVV